MVDPKPVLVYRENEHGVRQLYRYKDTNNNRIAEEHEFEEVVEEALASKIINGIPDYVDFEVLLGQTASNLEVDIQIPKSPGFRRLHFNGEHRATAPWNSNPNMHIEIGDYISADNENASTDNLPLTFGLTVGDDSNSVLLYNFANWWQKLIVGQILNVRELNLQNNSEGKLKPADGMPLNAKLGFAKLKPRHVEQTIDLAGTFDTLVNDFFASNPSSLLSWAWTLNGAKIVLRKKDANRTLQIGVSTSRSAEFDSFLTDALGSNKRYDENEKKTFQQTMRSWLENGEDSGFDFDTDAMLTFWQEQGAIRIDGNKARVVNPEQLNRLLWDDVSISVETQKDTAAQVAPGKPLRINTVTKKPIDWQLLVSDEDAELELLTKATIAKADIDLRLEDVDVDATLELADMQYEDVDDDADAALTDAKRRGLPETHIDKFAVSGSADINLHFENSTIALSPRDISDDLHNGGTVVYKKGILDDVKSVLQGNTPSITIYSDESTLSATNMHFALNTDGQPPTQVLPTTGSTAELTLSKSGYINVNGFQLDLKDIDLRLATSEPLIESETGYKVPMAFEGSFAVTEAMVATLPNNFLGITKLHFPQGTFRFNLGTDIELLRSTDNGDGPLSLAVDMKRQEGAPYAVRVQDESDPTAVPDLILGEFDFKTVFRMFDDHFELIEPRLAYSIASNGPVLHMQGDVNVADFLVMAERIAIDLPKGDKRRVELANVLFYGWSMRDAIAHYLNNQVVGDLVGDLTVGQRMELERAVQTILLIATGKSDVDAAMWNSLGLSINGVIEMSWGLDGNRANEIFASQGNKYTGNARFGINALSNVEVDRNAVVRFDGTFDLLKTLRMVEELVEPTKPPYRSTYESHIWDGDAGEDIKQSKQDFLKFVRKTIKVLEDLEQNNTTTSQTTPDVDPATYSFGQRFAQRYNDGEDFGAVTNELRQQLIRLSRPGRFEQHPVDEQGRFDRFGQIISQIDDAELAAKLVNEFTSRGWKNGYLKTAAHNLGHRAVADAGFLKEFPELVDRLRDAGVSQSYWDGRNAARGA